LFILYDFLSKLITENIIKFFYIKPLTMNNIIYLKAPYTRRKNLKRIIFIFTCVFGCLVLFILFSCALLLDKLFQKPEMMSAMKDRYRN